MREACDDLVEKKTAKRIAQEMTDCEKEMTGQALVDMSLKRKTAYYTSIESVEEILASAKKAKRVKRMEGRGEMGRFGSHLRDADLTRNELAREKLESERERSGAGRADRELEREERREKRKKIQELELANYKLLIEARNKK